MNAPNGPDRSNLSAFLDGQLSPADAERLAGEIQRDPALRAELEALEATRKLMAGLPRESAPDQLLDAVMEHVERDRLLHATAAAPQTNPLRWVRHLATAAIIVLTVGLGIFLTSQLSRDDWVDLQERADGPKLAKLTDATDEVIEPVAEAEALKESARGGLAPAVQPSAMAKAPTPAVAAARPASPAPPARSERTITVKAVDLAAGSRRVKGVLADHGFHSLTDIPPVLTDKAKTKARFYSDTPVNADCTMIVFYAETSEAKAIERKLTSPARPAGPGKATRASKSAGRLDSTALATQAKSNALAKARAHGMSAKSATQAAGGRTAIRLKATSNAATPASHRLTRVVVRIVQKPPKPAATRPATQPASQPASWPAPKPASQPTSQAASKSASRPSTRPATMPAK